MEAQTNHTPIEADNVLSVKCGGNPDRKLTLLKDENEIIKLFPLIIADGENIGLDRNKLNPAKLWHTLYACMTNAAIIAAREDGEYIGIMALAAVESYWSNDITLTNLIYYVAPPHRRSKTGLDLLRAAQAYALDRGLVFDLHVESYEDLDRKDKFFRRYGFRKCGSNYTLRRKYA